MHPFQWCNGKITFILPGIWWDFTGYYIKRWEEVEGRLDLGYTNNKILLYGSMTKDVWDDDEEEEKSFKRDFKQVLEM